MRNSESKSGLDFYCIFGRFRRDFLFTTWIFNRIQVSFEGFALWTPKLCKNLSEKTLIWIFKSNSKREFVQTKLHLLSKTDPFFVQQDANLQQLKNIKIPQNSKRKKYNYALRKTTKVFCLCKNWIFCGTFAYFFITVVVIFIDLLLLASFWKMKIGKEKKIPRHKFS